MSIVKDVVARARIVTVTVVVALAVTFARRGPTEQLAGPHGSDEDDHVVPDATGLLAGGEMRTTEMARSLRQIDQELRKTSKVKANTHAGDIRWQGAMHRIDRLLDERLVAEAEQLLLAEHG